MDLDDNALAEAGSEDGPIDQINVPDVPDKMDSIRAAARLLAEHRVAKRKEDSPTEALSQARKAMAGAAEAPEEDLAPEANTAPPEEESSGETEEAEPTEDEPESPIEPPTSWSAEERDRFAQLPREMQEYISTREQQRDSEIRRGQNEVAERLKALEPEAQAMQQARAQYEQALPMLLQSLQSTGEFADIKSQDDVDRLAKEDWPRYIQWDAHQKKVQAVHQEMMAAQQRQQQEHAQHWQQYAAEQDRLFAEKVPDITDPEKGKQLSELTLRTMQEDYGFTPEEMQWAWNGPFRDHRMQQILLDAAKFRKLEKNPPKPGKKPLPPVQRPGSARSAPTSVDVQIKALEDKFNSTGNLKLGAQILAMKRANASRKGT